MQRAAVSDGPWAAPGTGRTDTQRRPGMRNRFHATAALDSGALLVNVGRGPLVDHDALLAALRDRQLAGAGLDVFWHEPVDPADPLLQENVLATPHVGGVTEQAYRATEQKFAANVERLRCGEPLQGRAA